MNGPKPTKVGQLVIGRRLFSLIKPKLIFGIVIELNITGNIEIIQLKIFILRLQLNMVVEAL
jgi:hypothetical protein